MEYRELGRTGLKISALGFGASSLGGVFHSLKEADGIAAVHAAIDGGINFIDVSPYYGYLKAETVLGKALREIPRSAYILSTKVGRYGADGVNSWDYSAARVTRSVYESMERLGVDYIDIINVHDIEFANPWQVAQETLPALVELRNKGVVGHVGITDLQLENLRWMVEHVPAGTVESVLNFCHYCLCDDRLTEFLDFFESRGIGVINASPLSMGLLSSRGAPAWHPAPKALMDACHEAAQYCAAAGCPIEKLAMQYSVGEPRIASNLFSSTSPDNVRKNIEYISEPADPELVARVHGIIGRAFRLTWHNT
ncbi:MAG: aldo/keto reductase [Bacteroidales bacterium]|nr:aldo/keto reductase [Bacteroidales bacterium]